MPRPVRFTPGGLCFHVINRGNGRAKVFRKRSDYLAFLRILSLACGRTHSPMRLLGWCLMPNHFHLMLWPRLDGDLPRFMQWLMTCHVRRHHRHYKGSGHVWQGRYKCFAAQSSAHLFTVLRYIERNPVRAKLCARAEDWEFSSARFWGSGEKGSGSANAVPYPFSTRTNKDGPAPLATAQMAPDPELDSALPVEHWLCEGPIARPRPWLRFIGRVEDERELAALRASVNRGTPFGDEAWQRRVSVELGLESTLRPRGRPAKPE